MDSLPRRSGQRPKSLRTGADLDIRSRAFRLFFHLAVATDMIITQLRSLLTVILLASAVLQLRAQSMLPGEPAPAGAFRRLSSMITVEGGVLYNMSLGSFEAVECACVFKDGAGVGAEAGIAIDFPVNRSFYFTAALRGYHSRTVYTIPRKSMVFSPEGEEVSIDIERRADVTANFLTVSLMGKWYAGASRLYFAAGPAVSIVIDGGIRDEERIVTPGYKYPATGKVVFPISDRDLTTAYEVNTPGVALDAAAGYDFAVGRKLFISPEVSVLLPFTSLVRNTPAGPSRLCAAPWA
jgi:hypothetical protein